MAVYLLFIRGDLALGASSPTKIGKYLASALVVVAERAIGGIKDVLVKIGSGCLIDSTNQAGWSDVLAAALALCDQPGFRHRSIEAARRHFPLSLGVARYEAAYEYAVQGRSAVETPDR